MNFVSISFAVSAIGSVLYVMAFPEWGIMNAPTLVGTWRGVFTHKNVLGPIMSVAVFAELYIIVSFWGVVSRWRFALLTLYFALVVLSQSVTAISVSIGYLFATSIFLIWKRRPFVGAGIGAMVVLLVLFGIFILWYEPEFVLGILGKDAGLTGRTELWDLVVNLIYDRPALGYGYRSMWDESDVYRKIADDQTGGWGVTHAQNALLEIALELGIVGACIVLVYLGLAAWRAIACCKRGQLDHGVLSLIYIFGTVLVGQTEMTIGWNQSLSWLMFNLLYFGSGEILSRGAVRFGPPAASGRLVQAAGR
jgi:exopolysaccharide production protein ExoQ